MAFEKGWLSRQFAKVEEEVGAWPKYMREAAGFEEDGVDRVFMCSVCHKVYRKYKPAADCFKAHN